MGIIISDQLKIDMTKNKVGTSRNIKNCFVFSWNTISPKKLQCVCGGFFRESWRATDRNTKQDKWGGVTYGHDALKEATGEFQ